MVKLEVERVVVLEAVWRRQSTLKSLLPFSTFSNEKREIHFFKSKKSRAEGSLSSAEYCGTIITFW